MISAAFLAWLVVPAATDLPPRPHCEQHSRTIEAPIQPASTAPVARCPIDSVVSVGVTPGAKDASQPAVFTTEGRKSPIAAPSAPVPIV